MNPLVLALSFVRVPRLFAYLILWPLVIGMFMIVVQLSFTTLFTKVSTETSTELETELKAEKEHDAIRYFLYGSHESLPPPKVCRWGQDLKPNSDCSIEAVDLTVLTEKPTEFDPAELVSFFEGNLRQIHVCESCDSELQLDLRGEEPKIYIKGLFGFLVFMSSDRAFTQSLRQYRVQALEEREKVESFQGLPFIVSPGLSRPLALRGNEGVAALVLNVASLIVVTLWLMLRAHRRVLDYFARSGSLLPLVAACGKRTFYLSLWMVTIIRVFCFLLAAVPATIFFFTHSVDDSTIELLKQDIPMLVLWCIGVLVSMAALTIIGSIADLKHRHSWTSFLYKYVPLTACLLGSVCWFAALFFDSPAVRAIQVGISVLPVVGMCPIVLTPLVALDSRIVVAHTLLAALLLVLLLHLNARWFAAHLEEL